MDLMYIRFSLSIFCVLNHLNKISREKKSSVLRCVTGGFISRHFGCVHSMQIRNWVLFYGSLRLNGLKYFESLNRYGLKRMQLLWWCSTAQSHEHNHDRDDNSVSVGWQISTSLLYLPAYHPPLEVTAMFTFWTESTKSESCSWRTTFQQN